MTEILGGLLKSAWEKGEQIQTVLPRNPDINIYFKLGPVG